MKDIEKFISPFVESQFPSFYREEGPQFIAFVKAYYEWMEGETQTIQLDTVVGFDVGDEVLQDHSDTSRVTGRVLDVDTTTNQIHIVHTSSELKGEDFSAPGVIYNVTQSISANITAEIFNGGVLHHARHLNNYRDIDTTLDKFIVQFKEKYLKNIQFDTATNKQLLVKNALDLYRSKGTEQSIDLFFKLVYGTSAEVRYPAENILRVSDGVWEKPQYLEITYNQYNVNYVGKQVIGALSGAKAFVEKYIRRRVGTGYVNLLYISNVEGEFRNGEVIGINVNNVPDFTRSKMAQLIGSVNRVTIETKGRLFNVGDIVSLKSSIRGQGGLARVASVSEATGLVDFIFIDGGWGYTLNAESLISEKVLGLDNLAANTTSGDYFKLFDQLTQPLVNVAFTSATANLALGDTVNRYAANGQLVGTGKVVDVDIDKITVAHGGGTFTNTVTYYTAGNAASFYANTIEDRTISGKVMGIPDVYTLQLSNQTGTLAVGQNVYQKNTTATFARGTVNSITQTATGNVVILQDARGAFKSTTAMEDFSYTVGTGTITTNSATTIVVGSGTAFDNNYIGSVLYRTTGNVALGLVDSVINSTALALTSNAAVSLSANAFNYALQYPIFVEGNNAIYADVDSVSSSVGVYEIKKYVNTIKYSSANNAEWKFSNNIYQYNTNGNVISKGIILTVDHDTGTGSGNLTFIPVMGYFKETDTIYTSGNLAMATVVTVTTSNSGGDYINSQYSRLIDATRDTTANVSTISYGSGASFGVGTIGDTEVIFIGTDIIGANNVGTLDYDRKILTVASNTGFGVGSYVYQTVNKIAFNANSSVNAATGFITLPNANTLFTVGENIRYEVAAGNTALTGLINGDYYHVRFANTTGLILSYPYRKTDYINTSNFSTFANNKTNEAGHYLYKQVYGTVFESSTGVVKIKDRSGYFGNTGGTANTTTSANSNLIKYGTPTTNTTLQNVTAYTTLTQANQAFASLPIRAAAYGFPKNPQGDLADTIYSCLNFGRFEIGTIGSLNNINPGSQYNVDPYILAYQPYISGFDRKDFIITISNPTRSFIVGERVNQTLANLEYYDLKVSSGVYGNTYNEVQVSFDTKDEVSSSLDFIYSPSNTASFNANTGVSNNFIAIAGNPFSSNDYVRYYTASGNTALTGLSNSAFYYVGFSNSSGITLSSTAGGANIAITAGSTSETGHYIRNYVNDLIDGDRILYRTPAGNTALTGLANNTAYYLVSSNTVGFKLASTYGGSALDLAASGTSETHTVSTIPGYLPGDLVYQNTSPVMNASIQSVFSNTSGQYVRVKGNTATINVTSSNTLFSYTNPYVNSAVSSATLYSITSTAKGIVQAANSSTLFVKRLTFENTFKEGQAIVGDVSGASANIVGVSENIDELYPIGLNADIEANVITSNGQVTSLDVVDSGFGYSNGEIVQFLSSDESRSGSAKVIIDGAGMGKGYYRSSKGFLSEDMYIHDGDYYQEYSYEVLSKISVDRYSDMFRKVMHMAGTKFFGSALIVDEANVAATLTQISTSQEISFNAKLDVSTTFDTIEVNSGLFSNGDRVIYTTAAGNTVVSGLSNTNAYYIVNSTPTAVKLSLTANGSPINITASATSEIGHYLTKTVEE